MKIIAIRFLNLNSLKGTHEIRFDQSPLAEAGIFAITGATGSGKTTLLDAITVALYGRVHRHQKDAFEIMSRHTAEAYAEVEFEVGELLYRSKWSVRRARAKANGQLQTPKMELAEVATGRIIVEHPLQEVKDQIVAICGLDYSQFLRAVILSQGDFTRFLKADENERSELLEKITDTAIYSEISIAAFEKARIEKNKLEQLQFQLKALNLLDPEIRSAYRLELEQVLLAEDQQKNQMNAVRTQLDWLIQVGKLTEKAAEQSALLEQATIRFDLQKPAFERYQQHQKAVRYQPELSVLQNRSVQLVGMEQELIQSSIKLPDLKNELASIVVLHQTQTGKLQQLEAEQLRLEPLIEEVMKLDVVLEQARQKKQSALIAEQEGLDTQEILLKQQSEIGEQFVQTEKLNVVIKEWIQDHQADQGLDHASGTCQQLLEQLFQQQIKLEEITKKKETELGDLAQLEQSEKIYQTELEMLGAALKDAQEKRGKLEQDIQQHTIEGSLEQREEELRKLPLLIEWVGQQLKLASFILKNQDEARELSKVLQDYTSQELVLLSKQKDGELQIRQNQDLLDKLQSIYELEVKVQEFEPARTQLKPHEACPLCGSLEHPFVNGEYTGQLSAALSRRNQQQDLLRQLQQEFTSTGLELHTLQSDIKNTNVNLLNGKEDLQRAITEFEEINLRLPKPLDFQRIDVVEAVLRKKQQEQQIQLNQFQLIRKKVQDLQFLEQEQSRQQEKWLVAQQELSSCQLRIQHTQKRTEELHSDYQVISSRLNALELELQILLKPYGLSTVAEERPELLKLMQERLAIYQLKLKAAQETEQQLIQLKNDLSHLVNKLAGHQIVLDKATALRLALELELKTISQQRFDLFADADPRIERDKNRAVIGKEQGLLTEIEKLLKAKQQGLDLLEDRILQLERNMNELREATQVQESALLSALNTAGISSVLALESMLLPETEAQELQTLQLALSQELVTLEALVVAVTAELAKENAKALCVEDQELLNSRLLKAEVEFNQILEQKFKLKDLLSADERLQHKHQEMARAMELQEQEVNRFARLSALIGSADGKRFSRFAQGLTLSRLTVLANRHLLKLSDRYQILKTEDKDLDLQIVDRYQADVIRPMSTLSGGESFLVSLSLALGLSDLASKKVQINSLFIDEGFGTLDAETLDTAITALENLQSNGKSIGIISHVEALKERINTQIRLEKMPGGSSLIRITSGGF